MNPSTRFGQGGRPEGARRSGDDLQRRELDAVVAEGIASTIATRAAPVAELARGQLSEWVEEYKKATRTLETLGFAVGKFTISMGLLPEVHTTLSGTVESLRKDRIEELMQEHQDQPSTVTLLKALLLAKEVSDHLEGRLESVTLKIKLGIPPSVDVELH